MTVQIRKKIDVRLSRLLEIYYCGSRQTIPVAYGSLTSRMIFFDSLDDIGWSVVIIKVILRHVQNAHVHVENLLGIDLLSVVPLYYYILCLISFPELSYKRWSVVIIKYQFFGWSVVIIEMCVKLIFCLRFDVFMLFLDNITMLMLSLYVKMLFACYSELGNLYEHRS